MLSMANPHLLLMASVMMAGVLFSVSNALTNCEQLGDCASCVQHKDCYFCGAANATKCGSFTSDIFSIKAPSCPGLKYNWSTCAVTVADVIVIICVGAGVLVLGCCCCILCFCYCCCCKRCGYMPL